MVSLLSALGSNQKLVNEFQIHSSIVCDSSDFLPNVATHLRIQLLTYH